MSAHATSHARWYCEDCSTKAVLDAQSACRDCCGFRIVIPTHCGFGFGTDECFLAEKHP